MGGGEGWGRGRGRGWSASANVGRDASLSRGKTGRHWMDLNNVGEREREREREKSSRKQRTISTDVNKST